MMHKNIFSTADRACFYANMMLRKSLFFWIKVDFSKLSKQNKHTIQSEKLHRMAITSPTTTTTTTMSYQI